MLTLVSETDLKLTVLANLVPVSHKGCKSFCNIYFRPIDLEAVTFFFFSSNL